MGVIFSKRMLLNDWQLRQTSGGQVHPTIQHGGKSSCRIEKLFIKTLNRHLPTGLPVARGQLGRHELFLPQVLNHFSIINQTLQDAT
jgi:hypothetical protein